ncbi:MAG: hypothetical protein AUG51_04110 [Acidobacteria bacterium 13_1_20CM_3_53_8]|nr:MAG: hypothetical protein AUG51_04110 [Acidobacteria bacterium 13_1_20CM_3_53_8]
MSWISVNDYHYPVGWEDGFDSDDRAKWYCQQLEQGQILLFEKTPFELPKEHQEFLLSQRQTDSRYHKNISYRPNKNVLRGVSSNLAEDSDRLRQIMQSYSIQVTKFLSQFLSPYAQDWSLDFASFRPLEEEGRDLPLHKRNDLLHVDAFPSRPTRGRRILRVFTNINPNRPRIWNTTDRFDVLAQRFAVEAGLNRIAARALSSKRALSRLTARIMRLVGINIADRSLYDEFMLRFHDYLKENASFQSECPKIRLEFPPHSTWVVFTDGVPHAALSGQFALEHTYIVSMNALLSKHKAPISVLEAICGRPLSV